MVPTAQVLQFSSGRAPWQCCWRCLQDVQAAQCCCKSHTKLARFHVMHNAPNSHHITAHQQTNEDSITLTPLERYHLLPARPEPSLPKPVGPTAHRCHCSTSAPSLNALSVSAITLPPSCLLARA